MFPHPCCSLKGWLVSSEDSLSCDLRLWALQGVMRARWTRPQLAGLPGKSSVFPWRRGEEVVSACFLVAGMKTAVASANTSTWNGVWRRKETEKRKRDNFISAKTGWGESKSQKGWIVCVKCCWGVDHSWDTATPWGDWEKFLSSLVFTSASLLMFPVMGKSRESSCRFYHSADEISPECPWSPGTDVFQKKRSSAAVLIC